MTRRILLIEDEPISRDIISSLLVGRGYVVDVVADGFSALDRAKAVRYDVALVDYHLPEMDGYALGRLLCEQRGDADGGPILIGLTADRNGLAARRGADAVFKAILPKPIKPVDLFETIERLCGGVAATVVDRSPSEPAAPQSARQASAALWRSHGLAQHPKAFICPSPSAAQTAALGLCFDLAGAEQAELVLVLERHGINEAIRVARRIPDRHLPIIGLSGDHADICDGLFEIDDAASWRALAVLLGDEAVAPALPVAVPIAAVAAAPILVAAEPAPIHKARELTEPSRAADPEIRAIVLSGVNAPLVALRGTFEEWMLAPGDAPSGTAIWADAIAKLDQVLLVTGALADLLKSSAASEAEACAFDPAELVENAVAMVCDTMAPGGPRLTCRLDASVPPQVCGDVHRLSQILLTLLDDASGLHDGGVLTLHLGFAAGERPRLAFRLAHEPDADSDDVGWMRPDSAVIAQLRAIRMATVSRLVGLMGGHLVPMRETLFELTVPVDGAAGLSTPLSPAEPRPRTDGSQPTSQHAAAIAIDHAVREALIASLGRPSVERLTGQLLDQIAILCDGQADLGALGREARLLELSSCAAVLGLAELARCCAAFEPAADGRGDLATRWRDLRSAIRRVHDTLGLRRKAAA